MTEADIIGSAGGILNGVKVSSFGKIIGRVNQDRFSGVGGILNEYPSSIPVRVKVKDRNLGKEETLYPKLHMMKIFYNFSIKYCICFHG